VSGTEQHPEPDVRRGVPEDAERLTDLHLDVWDEAYGGLVPEAILAARRTQRAERVEAWRGHLAAGRTWVADEGDRLLGFASAGPARAENAPTPFELWALYVRRSSYGDGLGQRLFDAAVGDRAAYLWVFRGNDRAVAFYEKQGFRFDGVEKEEHDGVDLRMVRGVQPVSSST